MKNSIQIMRFGWLCIMLVLGSSAIAQPEWSVNPADFQYTMTFTGTGSFSCEESTDPNDLIAAFVGDECRGVANFNTEGNGSLLAFLTVYNSQVEGTEVSFKLYRASTDEIIDSPKMEVFSDGAIRGNPDDPYSFLTEYSIASIYVPGDSLLSYYEPGTSVSELFLINAAGDTISGVFDFVDDELGPDNDDFSLLTSFLILENNVVPGVQDTLQIHLQGSSEGGCAIDQVVVLPIINSNIPPIGLTIDTVQVQENQNIGTLVILLEAEDESEDDSHEFEFFDGALNVDHDSFEILGNELQTAISLNYESQIWYELFILITDEAGNSVVDTLWVEVLDEIEFEDLKVSNLLTPNNDGHNDTFLVPNVSLFQEYKLFIYNAQGAEVYSAQGYDNTWEGIAKNGKELPSATYYYVFQDPNQIDNAFEGEIHIYRNNKF